MPPSFEEKIGPVTRRIRRAIRVVRWYAKGIAGRPRTVLVELNWRLGDEIMAMPVVASLHKRFPKDQLAVLSNYPDLFEENPSVNAVNPKAPSPDRYLLLRGASRKAYRLQVYSEKAKVPIPSERPRLHYTNWETPKLSSIPGGEGPLIALAPGASWPSKRWPRERWNALAEGLEQAGCRLVILGQAGEEVDHGVDFTGQTSVREAACLLRRADLLVCCDSGLMHLALAVETPVVALFGPTDPEFLIRDEPNFTAIRSTQSCQGFWNHAETAGAPGECPEGHDCCLDSITVDQVREAVYQRLPAAFETGKRK